MLTYRYPLIAREGWPWIAVAVLLAISIHTLFSWLSLPLWLLVLLLLFLFRDPGRKIPAVPLGIVSPVDGRVERVESVQDAYLGRSAVCITFKMALTSVYSMHSPMEGKIMEQWMAVPRKIVFPNGDESPDVKTYVQWIQSDEADDVVLVVESTSFSSRPQCYAHSGERIGQGQRCGYIRFGSRVHVLVPVTTRIAVSVGDEVNAGADIIATLVHVDVAPPQIVAT